MKEGGTSGKFRSNIDLKIIQQVVVGGGISFRIKKKSNVYVKLFSK